MITVVCGLTLNVRVLLIKLIMSKCWFDQDHWYCMSCNSKILDPIKLIQELREKNRYI